MRKLAYQQTGLSMLELLMTLLISSFLILGISQIYIDYKRHSLFQISQVDNLNNSRFALLLLEELLAKAGYRRNPEQTMAEAFPQRSLLSQHCEEFPAESVISKIKYDANNSGQTGFCLRYQPAQSAEFSCDGSTTVLTQAAPFIAPSHAQTLHLAIKFTPDKTDANKGTLSCFSNLGEMELVSGLADMRVEFGSGIVAEKRLKNSSPFKSADSWRAQDGPVRVVRFSVLAGSRENQRIGDSNVFTEWLAGANSSAQARLLTQDKRRIYQFAVGTQALRNMMP